MMAMATGLFAVIFAAGFFVLTGVMVGLLWFLDRFLGANTDRRSTQAETEKPGFEMPDLVWDSAMWI